MSRLVVVAGVMCTLLFGGAGTMQYWQRGGYVSIFLGASVLTTVYQAKGCGTIAALAALITAIDRFRAVIKRSWAVTRG
jgi:hypothetical protein